MMFPNRFPFDLLDPAPDTCLGCGCGTVNGVMTADCQHPQCDCHRYWLDHADELGPEGLRALWGDR